MPPKDTRLLLPSISINQRAFAMPNDDHFSLRILVTCVDVIGHNSRVVSDTISRVNRSYFRVQTKLLQSVDALREVERTETTKETPYEHVRVFVRIRVQLVDGLFVRGFSCFYDTRNYWHEFRS